jgi:hypothetical protein
MSEPTGPGTKTPTQKRLLAWLSEYNPAWLRADVVAGITLAAYLLPAAIGDSSLANLPARGRASTRACSRGSCSGCSAARATRRSRSLRDSRCCSARRWVSWPAATSRASALAARPTLLVGGLAVVRGL